MKYVIFYCYILLLFYRCNIFMLSENNITNYITLIFIIYSIYLWIMASSHINSDIHMLSDDIKYMDSSDQISTSKCKLFSSDSSCKSQKRCCHDVSQEHVQSIETMPITSCKCTCHKMINM